MKFKTNKLVYKQCCAVYYEHSSLSLHSSCMPHILPLKLPHSFIHLEISLLLSSLSPLSQSNCAPMEACYIATSFKLLGAEREGVGVGPFIKVRGPKKYFPKRGGEIFFVKVGCILPGKQILLHAADCTSGKACH